ncbi:MAG TPA: DUF5996 family protein [Caulobacteraceae bacterium]|jgi:hypothetical protein
MGDALAETWPSLPYPVWKETCATLHLWTQMVGKVRLAIEPWLNHSWQTPLYVTARGLTTGVIHHPAGPLDLEFDFADSLLRIRTTDRLAELPLAAGSVADFYGALMELLITLGRPIRITLIPNELPEVTPFDRDSGPRSYDPDAALRFFRVLCHADRVLKRFRTGFLGKASPTHFFWGSFDLAVTRFSGRRAPSHPGGVPHLPDDVVREAYSHEVSSAGFWPGGEGRPEPIFYSYAYPEPAGFRDASLRPVEAAYDPALGEFVLPYEALRLLPDPETALLDFLQSTYDAAADLGRWDRAALDCPLGEVGRPRIP